MYIERSKVIILLMIEHRNHRYNPEQLLVPGLLAEARPDQLFELMNAQGYIDAHRFPKFGPLDFDMIANQVGITMIDMPDDNHAKGTYYDDDRTLAVAKDQRIGEQHVTFAHEIGHVFAKEKLGAWDKNIDLENFCDYFGYKMLFNGVDFEKLDVTDTNQIIEIAAYAQTDVIAVLQAWLAATDSGNILVTTKKGSIYRNRRGEISTDPLCRCRIISTLPCTETDEPITVDFSQFEISGSLPSFDHRDSLNRRDRKLDRLASLLGKPVVTDSINDDEPF